MIDIASNCRDDDWVPFAAHTLDSILLMQYLIWLGHMDEIVGGPIARYWLHNAIQSRCRPHTEHVCPFVWL